MKWRAPGRRAAVTAAGLVTAALVCVVAFGGLRWVAVALVVPFLVVAVARSSVVWMWPSVGVLLIATAAATTDPLILGSAGMVAFVAAWLLDTSSDLRREAFVDTRVIAQRRRTIGLVAMGSILLIGATRIAAVAGNDAGVYLPIGLFVGAFAVVAATVALRRTQADASNHRDFAPGSAVSGANQD